MKTQQMILTALFAALTAIGAFIIIPLPISPVPVTFQNFFTLLAGGLLGSSLGLLSQIIYVILGAIGLPVFAGGMGGVGALIGPTGGYIFGFIAAGYIAGLGKNNMKSKIIFFSLALFIIYFGGIIGLMFNTGMSLKEALISGVLPFLPGDMLKLVLALFINSRVKKII